MSSRTPSLTVSSDTWAAHRSLSASSATNSWTANNERVLDSIVFSPGYAVARSNDAPPKRTGGSGGMLLQHLARHDELLNLTGAFIDSQQARVTEQPFDRIFLDVAISTVNLQDAIRNSAE